MDHDTTKKKKLLFIITKSNWGGAQRYVFDLATRLPKDHFDIVVALGGDGVLITKLHEHNIKTISIPSLQRDISVTKELLAFREIARIIQTEQPDILHVNSSKAGGIGAFLGRLYRVPRILYTAHGWAFNEDRSWFYRCMVGFFHWVTIICSHTTICVSSALRAQMHWPWTTNKMVVIYNGRTTTTHLDREAARSVLLQKMPELTQYQHNLWGVSLGELHKVKRHDRVINATAELIERHPSYRHIIIGDGEEYAALQALVEKQNLTDHIFFAGHIDEAATILTAFDLFTLTSRSEAFGYAVLEAAQAGLPIVATNVGGVAEIITHEKEGLLVDPENQQALTCAIERLVQNTTERTALAQAAHIKGATFSLERMVAETMRVYTA